MVKPSLRRRGAETAGDVHAGLGDVLPQRLAGVLQPGIVEFGGEIGHGRVHVEGADGVTDDLVLFAHRLVRLVVFLRALQEVVAFAAPGFLVRSNAAVCPRSLMK